MAFEPENVVELAVRSTIEGLPLGLACERLEHERKYPDYRFSSLGKPLFILEVKELRCVKDSDGPDDLDEFLKSVSWTFADLTKVLRPHLQKAHDQFENASSVDIGNVDLPRVLWIRTELAIDVSDFERALRGVLTSCDELHDCDPSLREDPQIQACLEAIDMFVWEPVNGAMHVGFRQSDRGPRERRRLTFELMKMLHGPMQRELDRMRAAQNLPILANVPRKLFGQPLW